MFKKILIITTIDFGVMANHRVYALIDYWAEHTETLHVVSCLYWKKPRMLGERIRASNVTHFQIPIASLRDVLSNEVVETHFLNFLTDDYDLIFVEGLWAGLIGSRHRKLSGNPLVYEDLGYMPAMFPKKQRIIEELELSVMRQADLVFSVSQKLTNKRLSDSLPAYHSPNGLSPVFLNGREAVKHPPTVIYAGSLHSFSGLAYLIRAWPLVLQAKGDARVVILGIGPLEKKLKHLTQKLKLEDYVAFLGLRPHYEVPAWFSRADVGWAMLSSRLLDRYGFPLRFLEYLAYGLLPLVGKHGDMGVMVERTDIGLVCTQELSEIATNIIALLSKEYSEELYEKGQEIVQSFNWHDILERQRALIISKMD